MIQTAFLGDVVLTTPLLSSLARRHGPVDVVTTPAASSLLAHHPAVSQVIPYDKRGQDAGWGGLFRLGRTLRSNRYDRVYLPHRSWRTGALARIAGIPERVGFDDGARIFYTVTVPRPKSGHEVERLLRLVGADAMAESPVSIAVTPGEEAAADHWLASHGIAPGFVALAPGSIWGTKRWPYYGELAAQLRNDVVVIGGPDDKGLGEEIVARSESRARNAAGALPLRVSAALLRRASVLVTNDSAPLHLATAAAVPIVAIFGPTVPAFGFGPRGDTDEVVEHPHLSCRPCSRHGPQVCPLTHHRCMRDVGVEAVLHAISEVRAKVPGVREAKM